MKKLLIRKIYTFGFARKIKKNQLNSPITIEQEHQNLQKQTNPLETQKTISQLLEMGYSEAEVIKIIKGKQYQSKNKDETNQNNDSLIHNLPEKIQKELQNYDKVNDMIEQYKQKDTYLLKKNETNNEQLLYDELLEQITEGSSIMDNETYQKAQQLTDKKPFNRKDLIKVEKQRQLKLEQRAEIELVKKQLLEEGNFQRQNFDDQDYTFIDDQDEDYQVDKVEAMDEMDMKFQNDWVKQIGDASLSGQERAALENSYMEKFKISRQSAKNFIKKEFFERKKFEEKMNIRKQSDKQRERRKNMKKLFETLQKRSLEKLDYENEQEFQKEKLLPPGDIDINSMYYQEALNVFEQRLNSDKKVVLYDKWEIAKKRYSDNVRIIIEDAIMNSKFDLQKNVDNYQIKIDDIVVSANAHFLYIIWDFLDSSKNKEDNIEVFKKKLSINLNQQNNELETKLFFELNLRKKPKIVFIHSDKNQQSQMYKDHYIQEELQKQLKTMQVKTPEKYNQLINSGKYQQYIQKQTEYLDNLIGDEFEDYFSSQTEMRSKEKQIKKQLEKNKNKQKDSKNRHLHQKKDKKKLNKAESFWNKISLNQTVNILKPDFIFVTLRQNFSPLGEMSSPPKYPQ